MEEEFCLVITDNKPKRLRRDDAEAIGDKLLPFHDGTTRVSIPSYLSYDNLAIFTEFFSSRDVVVMRTYQGDEALNERVSNNQQ